MYLHLSVCSEGEWDCLRGVLHPGGVGQTPLPVTRKAGGTHPTEMLFVVAAAVTLV